ncbi:cytoplasmic polyadenylation element-binding protein 1 isoform X2 [Thrips palmi]|nr:cytoplasmic polyadenylation element-binding protein 1 isoform X2 [Thrips palmi]
MSIAELLGLNMPRGSLMGSAPGATEGANSAPQAFMGAPNMRQFTGDDSGYPTSHPGSPLPLDRDMSSPGNSEFRMRRNRAASVTFAPPSPSPASSPQSPFSPGFVGSRPYRVGSHTLSDGGSPLEQAFLLGSSSRSNSPESDTSLNSDNANLSDLMSCLYLHARARSDSAMSAGLPGNSNAEDQRQQELTNLTNLHALQNLTNNNLSLNFFQQNQQPQPQSPLSSPLSSPLASPDRAWSPSWSPSSLPNSLPNSLSSSLPGSPLFMSSPLRGAAPRTPPSPGSTLNGRAGLDSVNNAGSRGLRRGFANPQRDVTSTWSGLLPARNLENPTFSVKVFLGGVPWDMNDTMLIHGLKQFGMVTVEWPSARQPGVPAPKGYAYVIFESEKQVKALLQACSNDFATGGQNWYFKLSSKRMKSKEVQVIPWALSDTNWVRSISQKLDPEKTVFVGGLHGMLNAEGLAVVMHDLFDGVVYAGIDTDKFKYPIGSARVTFNNNRSFMKAVSARFVVVKSNKFTKKVQVDPYLEDSPCSLCAVQHGPYFCREICCFRYFCRSCWLWRHSYDHSLMSHKYLTRSSKSTNAIGGFADGLTMGSMSVDFRGPVRRDFNRLDGLQ